MTKDRNETEPPLDDDIEDFGPEDLELIRSSHGRVVEEDDYEEWPECPEQEWRREWLEDLGDPDDPRLRVVELAPYCAAVFERGELMLVKGDRREWIRFFNPRRYSDAEIRAKLKKYLLFL